MARVCLLLMVLALGALPVDAQDLVTRLQRARLHRIAAEQLNRGEVRLPFLPPDPIYLSVNESFEWPEDPEPEPVVIEPAFEPYTIDTLRVFSRLEAPVFANDTRDVRWHFIRGNRFSRLDTTRTPELRALLQDVLGNPTRTIAEFDSVRRMPRESIIQFEYWMVINDSLPVVVIDVNGPLERGLVIATDGTSRIDDNRLHQAVTSLVFSQNRLAPYVDYFFHFDTRAWYATGFDGATFFRRRIEPPVLALGRPSLTRFGSHRDQQR